MNTIPNFDGMTKDELTAFWYKYSRAGFKLSAELIGDKRRNYTILARTCANYAMNKACAMKLRLEGNIQGAMTYEHACELCYDQLPKDLQW